MSLIADSAMSSTDIARSSASTASMLQSGRKTQIVGADLADLGGVVQQRPALRGPAEVDHLDDPVPRLRRLGGPSAPSAGHVEDGAKDSSAAIGSAARPRPRGKRSSTARAFLSRSALRPGWAAQAAPGFGGSGEFRYLPVRIFFPVPGRSSPSILREQMLGRACCKRTTHDPFGGWQANARVDRTHQPPRRSVSP